MNPSVCLQMESLGQHAGAGVAGLGVFEHNCEVLGERMFLMLGRSIRGCHGNSFVYVAGVPASAEIRIVLVTALTLMVWVQDLAGILWNRVAATG